MRYNDGERPLSLVCVFEFYMLFRYLFKFKLKMPECICLKLEGIKEFVNRIIVHNIPYIGKEVS